MDAALFAKIVSDPAVTDWKKLKYKYPGIDLKELAALLQASFYQRLPLPDFSNQDLVYLGTLYPPNRGVIRQMLQPRPSSEKYGRQAMEEEIAATLTIESIDFSRESVRKILAGFAPADDREERIYGLKKGLDFISDEQNRITEATIHELYQIAIGPYLKDPDDLILPGHLYRHDQVFVVSLEVEHTCLPPAKLPVHMKKLLDFIQADDGMDDLAKAAIIHFYFAYLHPYFDGNGRMARLLHLWFLVQRGYPSSLYVPISSYIEASKRLYYQAFTKIEQNEFLSGLIDVTPFLQYFNESVYRKIGEQTPVMVSAEDFQRILDSGSLTVKERDLWAFVLSTYGSKEFSTKQLERDFGQAAYATIRSFVLKLTKLGLLSEQTFGNRKRYRVNLSGQR
ncbi:MAG: Fic family protein [Eubacteriales bacterium]|nr:Fic family protein [Eubacteriales bacterium]